MAANGLDILCSTTILREQTPATYCRKKENKCSNGRSSENNSSTNSRSRSKRNVGSTELQTMEDAMVNTRRRISDGEQNKMRMLKGAMVRYQTRRDGTAKNTHAQSSMKQQPSRAQFCCSLPSFSSYISPTSLVESEKISMAASSLWTHWVGQIWPCTSRKLEATNADALGRSWRTSQPKQLPMYQKKNYMQIGRPIPASSWSRVLQFAGRDKTFVHVITPMFHADGDVSMMMCRKRALVGWSEQCPLHERIIVRV